MIRVGLCLLTLDELQGCRNDVPNLPLDAFDEVFALDGGSTDGTVEFLQEQGIQVVDRIPLQMEPNVHNAFYLDTKKRRSGHLL